MKEKTNIKTLILSVFAIIVFISVIIVVVVGLQGQSEKTIPTRETEKPKPYKKGAIVLQQGLFTAGIDFPAGTYNVCYDDYNSCVIVDITPEGEEFSFNYLDLGDITFGESYKSRYENVNLEKGTTIEVIYNSIYLASADINDDTILYDKSYNNMKQIDRYVFLEPVEIYDKELGHRQNTAIMEMELSEGEYLVGRDIAAGYYDVYLLENTAEGEIFPEIEVYCYDEFFERNHTLNSSYFLDISQYLDRYKSFYIEENESDTILEKKNTLRIIGGKFKFVPSK